MRENRVITINEEDFAAKAFEVLDKLIDDGAPAMGILSSIIFPMLQNKLFYPEKESEEKEQE